MVYAKSNNIDYGSVVNSAGKSVKATIESVSAAAASAKMPADFRVSIVNAPGSESYPISTFTWMLVYEKNTGATGKILKDFLSWMLEQGQTIAPALGYAPLPSNVITMVRDRIKSIN